MATNKQCITRLQKEYKSLLKDPVPHVTAHPSNSLLEWHFVLSTIGGDYDQGVYHGKLVFPPQYPFKPPSISLFTPNGRFATNTKLCLSMTDYHPESWNPMWSVGSILTGLLSFMYDTSPTTGSITSTKAEKLKLAKESLGFNMKNPTFRKLFPEWAEVHEKRQKEEQQGGAGGGDDAAVGPKPPSEPPSDPSSDPSARHQKGGQAPAAVGQEGAGPGATKGAGPGADAKDKKGGTGRGDGGMAGGGGTGGAGSTALVTLVIILAIAMAMVPLLSGGRGAGGLFRASAVGAPQP